MYDFTKCWPLKQKHQQTISNSKCENAALLWQQISYLSGNKKEPKSSLIKNQMSDQVIEHPCCRSASYRCRSTRCCTWLENQKQISDQEDRKKLFTFTPILLGFKNTLSPDLLRSQPAAVPQQDLLSNNFIELSLIDKKQSFPFSRLWKHRRLHPINAG